jgi:hypothetical protein
MKTQTQEIESDVRGRPKSGRVWKSENKRFSNLLIQRATRTNWEKKMEEKNEKKILKKREEEMKNEKKQKRVVSVHVW